MQKLLVLLLLLVSSYIAKAALTEHEPNNTLKSAETILVNDDAKINQFDYLGDEDWFVIYAHTGTNYNIEIPDSSVGQNVNPVITIFNAKGDTIRKMDSNFEGEGERLVWADVPKTDFYYIRVTNASKIFDMHQGYKLSVYNSTATANVYVNGLVINACTQKPLANVLVKSSAGHQEISSSDGIFALLINPGTYSFTASLNGFADDLKMLSELRLQQEIVDIKIEFMLKPLAGCAADSSHSSEHRPEEFVAQFDANAGTLWVKDARIGSNTPIEATLAMQSNGDFNLIKVTPLAGNLYDSAPAYYNFSTGLAQIPYVYVNGQLYAVELLEVAKNIFRLQQPAVKVGFKAL